jgi:flagellar biosynthesis protein FlhF
MIVRRYCGSSIEKVQAAMRQDLGPQAIVVASTTRQERRWLPGLGRTVHEVTAVAEDALGAERPLPLAASRTTADADDVVSVQREQYRGLRRSLRLLDEKLLDVDLRLQTLSRALSDDTTEAELRYVHPEWREVIAGDARRLANNGTPTRDQWLAALARRMPVLPGIYLDSSVRGPLVHVLSGPTGVGKTTTLAKLAAKCVLGLRLKAAMITLDSSRMGGVAQLREYASLLGVDIAVAFSPPELQAHLQRFASQDVVFIDTPGRSPFDATGIGLIRDHLADQPRLHVSLLVPASVPRGEVLTLVTNYQALRPASLILTKLDEASTCEGLTRLLDVSGLPVAYVTDGQLVPQDIHVAQPARLAALILCPDTVRSEAGMTSAADSDAAMPGSQLEDGLVPLSADDGKSLS